MKAVQQNHFEASVSRCRSEYNTVLELEERTHAALYKALEHLYSLWAQIQQSRQLQAQFNQLLTARSKRQKHNPVLFLIQYTLFPHLLEFGSGNKPDQDKASRYAKLLNRAWEERVAPPRFAEVAPKIGIQNASHRTVPKKRMRPKSAPMKRVLGTAPEGSAAESSPMLSREVFPENAKVADDLDEAISMSYFGRQHLQLTGYADDGRFFLTEVKDNEPDRSNFRTGINANSGTAKTHQAPFGKRIPPKRTPTFLGPHPIGKQQPGALAKSMPSSATQLAAGQNIRPKSLRPSPARQPLGKQQPSQPVKKMP